MVWNSRRATSIALGLPLVLIAAFLTWHSLQPKSENLRPLTIGTTTIHVSIADTESSREQGLSGRDGLAPDEGMLFIFDTEGMYGFWMKEMKFSIDMLWLANDGTVVYIKDRASPDTYPQTFQSDKLARYVLEIPAGYSATHHIKVGDKAQL